MSWLLCFPSNSLFANWESRTGRPKVLGACSHVGNPEEASGSGLWIDLAYAAVAVWGVSQWTEDLVVYYYYFVLYPLHCYWWEILLIGMRRMGKHMSFCFTLSYWNGDNYLARELSVSQYKHLSRRETCTLVSHALKWHGSNMGYRSFNNRLCCVVETLCQAPRILIFLNSYVQCRSCNIGGCDVERSYVIYVRIGIFEQHCVDDWILEVKVISSYHFICSSCNWSKVFNLSSNSFLIINSYRNKK